MPGDDPVEPIYGKTYLPRKFKIAIGLPGDNSVDVYANDIGLLAICENWNVVGYNVLVGGSFGVTPSAKKTFPAVALPMCYIEADRVVDLCIAIVKVQRDFGNRADRKVARMKYLIHDWGLDRFRAKVEEYFGDSLEPLRPVGVHGFNDGMGWHEQGDGRWFYGLNVENGRIKDTETMRLKSALREICTTIRPPLRLTPHQSIIFCDIAPGRPRPARRNPAPPRRAAHRGLHDRPPLGDGLPRPAHLRPGGHRERTRDAVDHRPARSRAAKARPRKRSLHDAHDRLPERLRPAVQLATSAWWARPRTSTRSSSAAACSATGSTSSTRTSCRRTKSCRRSSPVLRYFKDARQNGETFGDFCHRVGKDTLLVQSLGSNDLRLLEARLTAAASS